MEISNEIVMLPIGEIKPYEKNPRKNSKTVELLVKIIPKVGFNVPLVLDKDHVIVKGHARYLAAQELGMSEIPCIISNADPDTIKADRIADNKVFEFLRWINEELMHEVDMLDIGLDLQDFGLSVIRFDEDYDDFMDEDFEATEDPAVTEERRRKFEEMTKQEFIPVQITTQQEIDHAKMEQRSEAKSPPNYFSITCEKCGSVMFVREGDDMIWE